MLKVLSAEDPRHTLYAASGTSIVGLLPMLSRYHPPPKSGNVESRQGLNIRYHELMHRWGRNVTSITGPGAFAFTHMAGAAMSFLHPWRHPQARAALHAALTRLKGGS